MTHCMAARHRLLVLAIAGLLMALAGCASSSGAVSPTTAALDHVFSEYRFNGTVLIARDGSILLDKGYGLADREHHVVNRPQTVFRIGSVTKQFTAMAVLLLQEKGRLRVQDPICDYLTGCPDGWRVITIHQLLTHTSGIPNIDALPGFDATKPIAWDMMLGILESRPLDFTPGERFSYSNSGYFLLGMIIQTLSGQPYATFLQQAILWPLHLTQTVYDDTLPTSPDHATGYADIDNPDRHEDAPDMTVPGAAGALASTVGDLYRWDQALFRGTIASDSSRQQMLTPYVSMCTQTDDAGPCPSPAPSYGYGWEVGKEPGSGRNVIEHGGSIAGGFMALNEYFPDQRVTVVLLSNSRATFTNFMNSSARPVLESILFPN